jgi:acetyl-CoA synthetase
MTSLLHKYIDREEYDSYEDFNENFKINVPEDFNFAYDIQNIIRK